MYKNVLFVAGDEINVTWTKNKFEMHDVDLKASFSICKKLETCVNGS